MKLKALGIDLAKSVFALHGVDERGKTVLRKKVKRSQLVEMLAGLPACVVGMEACGGSHYWHRRITALGHTVKLIAAQYVKPYVKTNKNDYNDAEAICEAVQRPSMRFVCPKSEEQQQMQAVHRVREQVMKRRTALANQARGLLAEFGIVVPVGIRKIRGQLPEILEDGENGLPDLMREVLQGLLEQMREVDRTLDQYEQMLARLYRGNEACQRLGQMPGVKVITATAMVASAPDAKVFANGRNYAAALGLVPRQASTGNRTVLLGISKRGNRYLRKLLVHGARAVVRAALKKTDRRSLWIQDLVQRRGMNRATVAVANKQARTMWVLLARGETYQAA